MPAATPTVAIQPPISTSAKSLGGRKTRPIAPAIASAASVTPKVNIVQAIRMEATMITDSNRRNIAEPRPSFWFSSATSRLKSCTVRMAAGTKTVQATPQPGEARKAPRLTARQVTASINERSENDQLRLIAKIESLGTVSEGEQ